jgi:hypothetical protein
MHTPSFVLACVFAGLAGCAVQQSNISESAAVRASVALSDMSGRWQTAPRRLSNKEIEANSGRLIPVFQEELGVAASLIADEQRQRDRISRDTLDLAKQLRARAHLPSLVSWITHAALHNELRGFDEWAVAYAILLRHRNQA